MKCNKQRIAKHYTVLSEVPRVLNKLHSYQTSNRKIQFPHIR